jgi:hypothetical protein
MYEFFKRRRCTKVLSPCLLATHLIFIEACIYSQQTVTASTCIIVKIKPGYNKHELIKFRFPLKIKVYHCL